MAAKVLVTYASRHGATKGIAQAIGSMLHSCGHQVRLLPAGVVQSVDGYDVVVIGSALYHEQWMWDARRLARRVRGELGERPVWLFSSGPVGGTPDGDALVASRCGLDTDLPGNLGACLRGADLRGHATFAGRIDPRVAAGMDTYVPHGDWRNMAQVREWARRIGGGASVPQARTVPAVERGFGFSLGRV